MSIEQFLDNLAHLPMFWAGVIGFAIALHLEKQGKR